jgi:hypothetical protein
MGATTGQIGLTVKGPYTSLNNVVVKNLTVTTIAGSTNGNTDGPTNTAVSLPLGVADGRRYISEIGLLQSAKKTA